MCDIPGPVGRVKQPLEFLGLCKTHNESSSRQHIPAITITGDATEVQILAAGQRYLERPTVMHSILNDLYILLRYKKCTDLKQTLDICLLAMERYRDEKEKTFRYQQVPHSTIW